MLATLLRTAPPFHSHHCLITSAFAESFVTRRQESNEPYTLNRNRLTVRGKDVAGLCFGSCERPTTKRRDSLEPRRGYVIAVLFVRAM